MRTRLLVVFSVLVGLLVLGLGIPLSAAIATDRTASLFSDRLGDTSRFAALASRAVVDDDVGALRGELVRYDEVFGIGALVVDREGRVRAASRAESPALEGTDAERVALALLGQRSEPPPVIWPWDTAPLVLAEPVLAGGEVRAASVTVSPSWPARHGTLVGWGVLAAAGLVALGLAAAVALPLVRWILAPVEDLDAGTARVAAAVRAGRIPQPVGREPGGAERGPPELRRLTRRFDQMATDVTHALESQRAFVADTGHQLRNPLTALRLRLQNLDAALADRGEESVDVRDECSAALEESDRLRALLDALLALARAEGRPARPAALPLDPVLAERVELWRVLAEHDGLRLVRRGPTGLVARSDVDAVTAVLDAALDNAVKYAAPGTEVELSTARVDDAVEIAVRDHGPGLDPAELAHATDRFWRSEAHRAREGTGLGLAIAARSAERAGGTLALELPDGGGLRVVLRLASARLAE